MFLPRATKSLLFSLDFGTCSNISLTETEVVFLLGSSTPTVFLPGIGAWIRTSLAPSSKAISLFRAVTLESLVPDLISSSYWVTVGPVLAATTLPSTPKSLITFSNSPTVSLIASWLALIVSFLILGLTSKVIGGL